MHNEDNNFAALWSHTTPRFQSGMLRTCFLAAAAPVAAGIHTVAVHGLDARLLYTALAMTLSAQIISIFQLCSSDKNRQFLTKASTPANEDIQKIAANIFSKAGLSPRLKPHVIINDSRLIPMDGRPSVRERNARINWDCSAYVYTGAKGPKNDRIDIHIGYKTLAALNRDELSAVIAHEAGHVCAPPDDLYFYIRPLNKIAGILFFLNLSLLNPFTIASAAAATWLTRRQIGATHKLIEERADRSSLGLYPHSEGLSRALAKIAALYRHESSKAHLTPGEFLKNELYQLWNLTAPHTHPSDKQRTKHNEIYFIESVKFHKLHNIPSATGPS